MYDDGERVVPKAILANVVTASMFVAGNSKVIGRFSDIAAAVVITNVRVAIACTKYDKGGGWRPMSLGGLAVAATANAVSKARAKRRSRGKTLVGHVRYEWLTTVDAKDRTGFGSKNTLSLIFRDPIDQSGLLGLTFILEKHQPATDLASAIAVQAAQYKASVAVDDGRRATNCWPTGRRRSTRIWLPALGDMNFPPFGSQVARFRNCRPGPSVIAR